MGFDFETLADRRGTGNMKLLRTAAPVSEAGAISYAGAEMDFRTAPAVVDALERRARTGLYGFTIADRDYLDAVVGWMRERRGWKVAPEWIVPTSGTLQAISAAIRAFSRKGDGIIVQPPVYMMYNPAIEGNRRAILRNPLRYDRGRYSMDFDDLERCMAGRRVRLMILCNPHNPIGRVWEPESLARVAELAERHGVLVVSDEIFGEVTFPGHPAICYGSLERSRANSVVCTSLGKTFNFTGSSHANVIIPDRAIRDAFRAQRDIDHYGSMDPFIYAAVIAAYRHGGAWVDAMIRYVEENIALVRSSFSRHLPEVTIAEPEGTFLIWIDWRALGLAEEELERFLLHEARLELDRGSLYGKEGAGFTRMNVASPRDGIERSLGRLLCAARARGFAVGP
jgi:cystathionine beta-lyase